MSNKELLEYLKESLKRYETGHEDCQKCGICFVMKQLHRSGIWYHNEFRELLESCLEAPCDDMYLFPAGDIPPRIDLLKRVIKKVESEGIEL